MRISAREPRSGHKLIHRALHITAGIWVPFLSALVFAQQPHASPQARARTILEKALDDKNPDTRKLAVIALSLAPSREPFMSWLESKLEDKDVEVRVAAIATLVDMKSKRTFPKLRNTLDDRVPEVSFAAAKALFALHDPTGEKALLSVLRGESRTSSGYFSKQLRDTMRMMHTPKSLFLFAIRQGVGFVPVPGLGEGVSSVEALLSDPEASGQATAALLLGRHKDKSTLEALRKGLLDNSWTVRAAAVHALALWDEPALQRYIVPLLDDSKQAVRLRAAAGLLRLKAITP
jgi:HEAT repeat protein